MIRVVLDTNVIVSACLNQDGLPFLILKLALAKAVLLWRKFFARHDDCARRAGRRQEWRRGTHECVRHDLRRRRTGRLCASTSILAEYESVFVQCAMAANGDCDRRSA
jgi:hypothetical protein